MSNEQVPTQLGARGQEAPASALVTDRYPLVYAPQSSAQVNLERLPPPGSYCDMELAYREQFYTDETLKRLASTRIYTAFFAGLGATIAAFIVGPILSLSMALSFSGAAAFFIVLFFVLRKNTTIPWILMGLLAPPIAVMVFFASSMVLAYRTPATVVLGLTTLAVFFYEGNEPIAFYYSWLYTHPRLRPETRRRENRIPIPMKPDWLLLAGILVGSWLGASVSPTVTLLAILAVTIVLLWPNDPKETLRMLKVVLGRYMTYGLGSKEAPGVWVPKRLLYQREANVYRLTITLFLTLGVSLYAFCPFDLFLRKIQKDFGQDKAAQLNAELLGIYLRDVQVPSPQDRLKETLASPYGWIEVAIDGAVRGEPVYVFMFPIALGVAVILPILVVTALYRKPLLALKELQHRIDGQLDNDGRPEWQWYVDRLRSSTQAASDPLGNTVREAAHLFMGVEPYGQFPVLLDREILKEHCYIVGETGSGKTSLGIMPLLLQLIRGANYKAEAADGKKVDLGVPERRASEVDKTVDMVPIVILDLKGDPVLFQAIRKEAEDRHQDFRFFTPEPDRASHHFNPFQSLQSESRTLMQLCQILLDSLSLAHGEGYGRSYYTRRSRETLYAALGRKPQPQSFKELYGIVEELSHKKEYHESFELVTTIHALSEYTRLATLQPLKRPEQAIHMPSVLERRQIVYFWLPAAIESISVREIGKLACFSLLTAAIDRQRAGKEPRQAYLVIDEFQRLAGENFKVVLEQARSYGVSAILSNQTQADLKIHDVDLRPTVRTNTRTKMYFSVSDPGEIRDLSLTSGEELALMKAWSLTTGVPPRPETRSWAESIKARLTTNDIIRVSDHPLDYILQISRGNGYTQFAGVPLMVRTIWPIHEHESKRLSREAWPTVEPYEQETPEATAPREPSPKEIEAKVRQEAVAAMRQLKVFGEDES